LLRQAELSDQAGIDLVGLGPHHPGCPICLDLRWIDHADGKTGIGQIFSDRLPIGARGFHAHVQGHHLVFLQPLGELGKTSRGIVHHLAAILAIDQAQGNVQLGLGDINSEYVIHVSSLRNLPCEYGLPTKSGQRYCPISRRRIEKDGALSTERVRRPTDGYGVRPSRSGNPEYSNNTVTIQGWVERSDTHLPIQHAPVERRHDENSLRQPRSRADSR
jgi:hypothetical protein